LSDLHRVRGVKVLKAVSSSLRLQILNLLFDKGSLSYTELMNALKMNPTRDAGRFAYHLKFLLKADLIEADVEARKYLLTELGNMVIDVADRIEKSAYKPKNMLVRASRLAIEDFDANRIAVSLMREAKMPAELAQKVAKEAEKRLLKSKTKYLTAPLVREIVNGILIEKGLEDYRHRLTRLGLPIHEVSSLIESRSKASEESTSVYEAAGEAVLKEYVLLKIFPRDIADAHLSGALHISDLGSWVLKPAEIVHDLRFFFQNGLNLEKISSCQFSHPPPRDFESALATAFNVVLHSVKEIGETQLLEYFNVFLASYARGVDTSRAKEALRSFILNLNHHAETSLGLELTVPAFLVVKPAVGSMGRITGKYGDFIEEAQVLASLILEVFAEESKTKPLFNPKIVVKIRSETYTDMRAKALLLKAHGLASEKGMLCFAYLPLGEQEQVVFSGSGSEFGVDFNGDWEIDTLRTCRLGTVTVNLPRIAYECEKDKQKFLEVLRERLELAARALDIKYTALRQRGEGLLPFLMQNTSPDRYLRFDSAVHMINLAGLKETMESFLGKNVSQEGSAKLIEDLIECVSSFVRKAGKRRGRRLLSAMLTDHEASTRLAQLDIDRYGVGKAKFSGTRENPHYSTFSELSVQDKQISSDALSGIHKLRGLCTGGSLIVVELGECAYDPDELMSLTKQITEGGILEFFTYGRRLTYCTNCRQSWLGMLRKCPSCGAVSTLKVYDRYSPQ